MKNLIAFTLFTALLFSFVSTADAKPKLLDTGRGDYEVLVTKPKGSKAPHPLLVIVPAKKYTMDGEIFEDLAKEAASHGFFVVRFNWGFVTNKDTPSEDFSTEKHDLAAVIKYFKNRDDIDEKRIYIAAKSFGSQIAIKEAYDKWAKGIALITPNCSKKKNFRSLYAPLFKKKKPTHIVISKDDPHCDIDQIYRTIPSLGKKNIAVNILYGDHNFKTKNKKDQINHDLAVSSISNWLKNQLKDSK